jgi:NAD(P)-dependent dehydrogenase (short-subunit alcohol dehydrogenase family)
MRLKGKRVILTGAASGIGQAGALLFAREGATLVAVDRDTDRLQSVVSEIEAAGGRCHPLVADLSKVDEARRIIREGAKFLGGLDAFWGNAGINCATDIESIDWELYDLTMAVNVAAVVASCSEAAPLMRKNPGGSIVLTSSSAGLVGSIQSPIYSAAKFGVVGLAKSLALRFAADNIRVNAICPGPVDTPLLREVMSGRTDIPDGNEIGAKLLGSIPLGRLGRPIELAEAALWLSSDASSFVTGVALPVDGGLTAR